MEVTRDMDVILIALIGCSTATSRKGRCQKQPGSRAGLGAHESWTMGGT